MNEEMIAAISKAMFELGALIPDPRNPSTSDWPCENSADRECLQAAYLALMGPALSSRD